MNTCSPLVFTKAADIVFKEYSSSDSDSSVEECCHRRVNNSNVLPTDSEDDDDDVDPSRKLESNAVTDLDPLTLPTPDNVDRDDEDVEMNERKIVRRCNAKRKIGVSENLPVNVSDTEERPKRSTRHARSDRSKDDAMDEEMESICTNHEREHERSIDIESNLRRSTRTTASNKFQLPNHPYITRSARRGRTPHSEISTSQKTDSSTPISSKNTIASESPRRTLQVDIPKIIKRTTEVDTDDESESETSENGFALRLRSRRISSLSSNDEKLRKKPEDPNASETPESESSEAGPAIRLRSRRIASLSPNDEKLRKKPEDPNASETPESESSEAGPALRLRSRRIASLSSNDEKLRKKQEDPKASETPKKLRSSASRTRTRSGRQMCSMTEKLAKVKLKDDEMLSPRTRSFTIAVPKCDDAEASTPLIGRHSTRAAKFAAACTDQARLVKSSARVRSSAASRDVESHADAGESTPSTRSKCSTKQPTSCRKKIVYDSDDDCRGGDTVADVPSSDSSDDYVLESISSSESGEDSDDLFYPEDRRLRSSKNLATPRILRTPRTPRVNVRTLTPSLPSKTGFLSTPTTPKDRAMRALHISSVPESLPCRQREFDIIYNFLRKKVKGTDGGFMYVYGIPGAGKTATVERVIKRLEMESSKKQLDKFTFVDINGMHLKQPKDVYCQILKKLDKLSKSAPKAKTLLEQKFQTVFTKRPLLLLIDEFDQLFNRTLSVVDTLLDWIDQSKLIIVGIANSKDLIEEIGRSSTKSRMLRERLCDVRFETYTFKQLQEIIEDRLKEDTVFTRDAIELLARKSALSGDVRLALNLCRRVLTEAGDVDAQNAIGASKVVDLLERIHKDPKIELIKSLATQDRMLLRALCDVILLSGRPTCSLAGKLYEQYKAVCLINGVTVRDEFSLFRSLRQFERYALITLSESDCDIHTEIGLGNNIDLIQMALQSKSVI